MTMLQQHEQNVGLADQVIRMILGLAIMSLAFFGPQSVWAWLGAVFVYAGAFSYDPIYNMLGINTAGKHRVKPSTNQG